MTVFSRAIFAVLLMAFTAMTAAETQPIYTTDPGPLAVDVLRPGTLHDAARQKDLYLTIVAPNSGGPYPVILFSHGAGGSPRTYLDTLKLWASHGYVIVAPFHDDSLALQRMKQGADPGNDSHVSQVQKMRQAIAAAMYDQNLWVQRVKDIQLILDHLKEFPDRFVDLHAQMDLTRIGMAGHSLGAQTTVLMAGAVIDFSPEDTDHDYVDRRIKAAIMMSGEGRGHMGFRTGSWNEIHIPMMVMTGTRDSLAGTSAGPQWKLEPYKFSPPGDKFAVLVRDATHFSFCSNLSAAIRQHLDQDAAQTNQILSDIELPTLPFWDAYLKADSAARALLHSDQLKQSTQGDVQIWSK